MPYFSLASTHDGAPFRSFVGERGELGGVGEVLLGNPTQGLEIGRLAVAERDRPRLVEEKRIDVA